MRRALTGLALAGVLLVGASAQQVPPRPPDIATEEASMQGYEVKTARFPFQANGKALGLGDYQMLHERAIVNHLHLVCLAHLLLTHHAMDRIGAKAIVSNKEVRLPSVEQRIANLRQAARDQRIRRLFRKGAMHARYRKRLEELLAAA